MDYAVSRQNMIDGQITPNRVTDPRVIAVMSELPRERFLPKALHGIAYVDEALAIGRDRHAMEPLLIARMIQEAQVDADDIALVVGCASGYEAAVLARICGTVVAVESDAELLETATSVLNELGIDNAIVVEAGLGRGYPKQAPYDVIFVNGAVSRVPDAIVDQLADGGRLVYVRAGAENLGQARLIMRLGETVSERSLFDAGTPLLPGFAPKRGFRL